MEFLGNGLVWDKAQSKTLCKFTNGIIKTNDKRTIKILKDLGYKPIEEVEVTIDEFSEINGSD